MFQDCSDVFIEAFVDIAHLAVKSASASWAAGENLLGDAGAEFVGTNSTRAGGTCISITAIAKVYIDGSFIVVRDVEGSTLQLHFVFEFLDFLFTSTVKVLRSRALPEFKKLDNLRTSSPLSERFPVSRIGLILSSANFPEIMILDMEVATPPRYARSCSVSRWIACPFALLYSNKCSF
jgi:hypothetical protein